MTVFLSNWQTEFFLNDSPHFGLILKKGPPVTLDVVLQGSAENRSGTRVYVVQ